MMNSSCRYIFVALSMALAVSVAKAQYVQTAPTSGQTVAQPVSSGTNTTLGVNDLNNFLYAGQYGSSGGIAAAGLQPICLPATMGTFGQGCMIIADPAYPHTEVPAGIINSQYGIGIPLQSHLGDFRGGTQIDAFHNPVNFLYSGFTGPTTISTDAFGTARYEAFDYTQPYGNAKLVPSYRQISVFSGADNWYLTTSSGSQYFPNGLIKEDIQDQIDAMTVYSNSQAIGGHSWTLTSLKGHGDVLGPSQFISFSGGFANSTDEGIHWGDRTLSESTTAFLGVVNTYTPSTYTIKVTPTASHAGTQGEGRYLLDFTQAGPTGNIVAAGIGGGSGFALLHTPSAVVVASLSGTSNCGATRSSSCISTAYGTLTAAGGGDIPPVANTRAPAANTPVTITIAGGVSGTSSPFAAGIVCIADESGTEQAILSSVGAASSGTQTANLTLRYPHLAGAAIFQGGLCGYSFVSEIETLKGNSGTGPEAGYPQAQTSQGNTDPITRPYPIIGSVIDAADTTKTLLYVWYTVDAEVGAPNWLVPFQGSTGTYPSKETNGWRNVTQNLGSVSYAGGTVTVTTNSYFSSVFNPTAQQLTLSVPSDTEYDLSPIVTVTGPNTFTFPWPGSTPPSNSSPSATGATAVSCLCAYHTYPSADVVSVYNQASGSVDGTLQLEPNNVAWFSGPTPDSVEQPHWHEMSFLDNHDFYTLYQPSIEYPYGRGFRYAGTPSGQLQGLSVWNYANTNIYNAYGGVLRPPETAYMTTGVWAHTLEADAAPEDTVLFLPCKRNTSPTVTTATNGCTRWDAAYGLAAFRPARNSYESERIQIDPANDNVDFNIGGITSAGAPTLNFYVGDLGNIPGATANPYGIALTGGTAYLLGSGSAPALSVTGPTVLSGSLSISGGCTGCGGVTSLVAGSNITLSPTSGTGVVTISATGGGTSGNATSIQGTPVRPMTPPTGTQGLFYDGSDYTPGWADANLDPSAFTGDGGCAYTNAPGAITEDPGCSLDGAGDLSIASVLGGALIAPGADSVFTGVVPLAASAAKVFSAGVLTGGLPIRYLENFSVDSNGDLTGDTINLTGGVSYLDATNYSGADGNGNLFTNHIIGGQYGGASAPTVVEVHSGAGLTGTATLDGAASDAFFNLTVSTSGGGESASTPIARITFGTAYTAVPHCVLFGSSSGDDFNGRSGSEVLTDIYGRTDASTWTLYVGKIPLADGTTFAWDVHCGQ